MGIRVISDTEPRSPAEARRLQKLVENEMRLRGCLGRSASGMTLAMAVAWCERLQKPYVIHAHPGRGYYLELKYAVMAEREERNS